MAHGQLPSDSESTLGARTDFLRVVRNRKVRTNTHAPNNANGSLTERNLALQRAAVRANHWRRIEQPQVQPGMERVERVQNWVDSSSSSNLGPVWVDSSSSSNPVQPPQGPQLVPMMQLPQGSQFVPLMIFHPSNPPYPNEARGYESSTTTEVPSSDTIDTKNSAITPEVPSSNTIDTKNSAVTPDDSSDSTMRFSSADWPGYSSSSDTLVGPDSSDSSGASVNTAVYNKALENFLRVEMAYDNCRGIKRKPLGFPGPLLKFPKIN
ncbi:hypothetical protein F4806DRAFT_271157 [Annulohypoxylon nitens]|nr:hypothetical protein F4806DRAFT_271157 [Annulohypoxylon nitens]